jgi:AcrR family transcriptional regulator
MGRPRQFDRAAALQAAIKVFADHGYEGTSTEALLTAMGISRQSLYDTFGDKRRLYLEALQTYNADSVSDFIQTLGRPATPLKGLETALLAFAARPTGEAALGCMGVGAICEFGHGDSDVRRLNEAAHATLLSAVERWIGAAKATGEASADLDPRAAAQFVGAILAGLKVSNRAGASQETLRAIAQVALRSLR